MDFSYVSWVALFGILSGQASIDMNDDDDGSNIYTTYLQLPRSNSFQAISLSLRSNSVSDSLYVPSNEMNVAGYKNGAANVITSLTNKVYFGPVRKLFLLHEDLILF